MKQQLGETSVLYGLPPGIVEALDGRSRFVPPATVPGLKRWVDFAVYWVPEEDELAFRQVLIAELFLAK